jgi:hypothetical protein
MVGQRIFLSILFLLPVCGLGQSSPDQTKDTIRRSAEATHADWERAGAFDFCETDKSRTGSRTSAVLMIEGSPYNRLVQIDGKDLPPAQETEERNKLAVAIQQRKHETPQQRANRVAKYQKERRSDRELLGQLTDAMNFTFVDAEVLDSYQVNVFDATPRPGYVPTSMDTEVLPGMKGKLWIDKSSFRWVKVEAEVVKPVSIAGFLARVEPGTRFELEERPIGPNIWLPEHFTMRARAKILFLIAKSSEADETYFNYRPNGALPVDSCKAQP